MLHLQKYLETHTPEDLKTELDINFKAYDDRVIFKYGIKSPKYHPIVKECRGIVLSLVPGHTYEVMARGFDRFYNFGEGNDCEVFDWNNCIIFNKMDGSLIKVYHDGNRWCTSTNGTAFAEGETPMGKSFHDLFVEAIGMDLQEMCKDWDTTNTSIFELTSPENRIVTKYYETFVTLLAVRDNLRGFFVPYWALEVFVEENELPFKLCDSYPITTEEDLKDFVEGRDQLDEGCVLYDKGTQMRIKMKNSSYVAIHHLRGNEVTVKSIISLLLKSEIDEYLVYFDTDLPMMEPYINKYNELLKSVGDSYDVVKHIENQKEFALIIKDVPYKGLLFSMRKGKTLDELFNLDNLNMIMKLF